MTRSVAEGAEESPVSGADDSAVGLRATARLRFHVYKKEVVHGIIIQRGA